ncbi:ABC transporter ATP-binding protein [Frankia sp. CcI49]|uniref:ABC transporter ATP-binding protein n=1 Tax=Frankia sp. CcI49 TaxID=1745382 RepID=UPI001F519439|nr:ABC transporter ATP-binding protein [Frankia sp. CcI49]
MLRDVSFRVMPGQMVALLGANGAGKTTTLRAAAGLLRPTSGQIALFGAQARRTSANIRAKDGVCLIPEGRGIFRSLTVRENLRLHGAVVKGRSDDGVAAAIEAFPALRDRLGEPAGRLSGGQQQMVALARAYIARPRLILLDEVSLGLAPKVVDEIFVALGALAATGVAMVLVEQYVQRAMAMADEVILLRRGAIEYSGPPSGLDEEAVVRGYLGHADDAGADG